MISVESLVAQPDPRPAQEERPAQPAQREAGVEDEEGERHEPEVGLGDQPRDLGQLRAVEDHEHGDDREREEDRDDRPRLAQPRGQRTSGSPASASASGASTLADPGVDLVGRRRSSGRRSRDRLAPGAAVRPIRPLPRSAGRAWRPASRPGRTRLARPGTTSAPARAASSPAGVDGSPSSGRVRDARPRAPNARRRRRRRAGRARERRRRPARCRARRAGRCASRPSRPTTPSDSQRRHREGASRASGRTGAGCRRGRPARGPPRSSRRPTGRAGSRVSRKTQMRSPSRVFTSSPTRTVSPAGASARASSAPSIRSWSVIARCVSPRSTPPGRRPQAPTGNRS